VGVDYEKEYQIMGQRVEEAVVDTLPVLKLTMAQSREVHSYLIDRLGLVFAEYRMELLEKGDKLVEGEW
jgi:hypothetical protein